MHLKFLFFAVALAAMGPAREAPPPDPETIRDSTPQRNPARLPPVSQRLDATEPVVTPLAEGAPPVLSAADVEPSQFLWSARPVVVFADTPDDPAFLEQIEALRRDGRALAARDVVVVTDSNPDSNSAWRQQLRPRGFSLVLIDKDGQVKIRRPSPWDAREIGRAIDRLPLRRQEIGRGSLLR
ncbi:DUF4174 domain-containing protein [Paracoccus sp. (in: a-proteobacteria)]|uniref:DUF4174 domain-containing protein n=1 Tax=Paracoccus sp. TaxID=267 RepID=UPI00396C530A